jgi:hypothetical protein
MQTVRVVLVGARPAMTIWVSETEALLAVLPVGV